MPGPNVPYTHLDSDQVIKQVYDESTDRLRVDTGASISFNGEMEVNINHIDDSVAIGDGSNLFTSTSSPSKIALYVKELDNLRSQTIRC